MVEGEPVNRKQLERAQAIILAIQLACVAAVFACCLQIAAVLVGIGK